MPRLPSFVNGFPTSSPSGLDGNGNGSGSMTPGPYPYGHPSSSRRGTGTLGVGHALSAPVSVLSLEQAHLAGEGVFARIRRGIKNVRIIARLVWRTRESVLGRSAREVWAVFWVAGLVWVGVNALFFWG